jgi:ubiquinone/menaquinone biosynthesis C-methylase UbiE
MRKDAIELEEKRLHEVHTIEDYGMIHERHRIFPKVFENRRIERALDIAAGVGVVGRNIAEGSDVEIFCNDICPKCLQIMADNGLKTVSFDIDTDDTAFPFTDGYFDAVIVLSTIEHVIHIDHFVKELLRILRKDGYLFISAPNYSGLPYLLPFLLNGKTFHDPMSESSRYEFYGHVRYFTYTTLLEFISSFGFVPDTVYVPLPENGSRYQELRKRSPIKAAIFRFLMKLAYRLSPRWAAEPVLCFQKASHRGDYRLQKVIL